MANPYKAKQGEIREQQLLDEVREILKPKTVIARSRAVSHYMKKAGVDKRKAEAVIAHL